MGMVCVAKNLRCQCVVRDNSKNDFTKFEVTLPASTPVLELITQVAEKMNYEPSSFQLTSCNNLSIILTEKTPGSLESAGLTTDPCARNMFLLEGIGGREKNLVARLPASSSEPAVSSPPPPPPENKQLPSYKCLPPARAPAAEYTFVGPLIKHETGYVGLVNQAMTCYLNSLLQALYMTPEFRNALYKWKFDGSQDSKKCIPYQLQKLFLNLQTSSKTAVETTELTRSFGWESGEVWQQHDIQELCRVMFDALEQEFKDTEQADLINQLYQGKMTDYVKCLECGTEKSRVDTFLDIPLPVRPFGSTVAYGSVEEALKAFVQPETLEGNNQYKCDKCGKKCDAHKGLKFTKFPYLLTLHLKRFDFDYNSLHRIKLNDKLVFPQVLDLNSFVNSNMTNEGEGQDTNHDDMSIKADSVLDEETNHSSETQNTEKDQDEDEGIDLSINSGNNHENEKNRRQDTGPYLYELYSIMIHSGSASGGHYYAYIKDFARSEWYCFNDQSVTSITHEDIKKTYGGVGSNPGAYYSGAYSSSTNAYMLMYRQINKELNCYSMVEEDFPPHIKKLLEELKEAEEKEKAFRAKQEEMIRIKVHANHPMLGQPRSHKLFFHNDSTVDEVKSLAYSSLKLEDVVPEDRCRLVIYNKTQEEMIESLDGRGKDHICDVFNNLSLTSNCELLLEIREKDKKFLPYNFGDIKLIVFVYDSEKQTVEDPQEVRTSPCQTLSDLKKLLQEYIPLKTDDVHVVLAKANSLEYISQNDVPLNRLGFSPNSANKVFICYKGPEGDLTETFSSSEIHKLLDEVKNVITLQINVPDTKKETLELLLIPPLISSAPEKKTSDSTPTGDGLPIINGLQEEELGYCSGAGGTSDQSTSEDSSLTDSDRTIIGEPTNECQLSSPSDSDQQFSSSENHGALKGNLLNGEIEKWHLENDELAQNYYFLATPYTADGGQKMLRVVVDRSIDLPAFKKKLEKYIGVSYKFMKLLRGPEEQEITTSLRCCKDHERLNIKLERVLIDGEHRIRVNHLDISNSAAPDKYVCDWIVCNGDSIALIKKEILKEVEKRAGLKIPYERCRLRKQSWKNPGAVLLDSDVWDEMYRSSARIEVYIQELDGPDPVTQSSQTLFFVRRWSPSTMALGPFQEVVMDSANGCTMSQKVVDAGCGSSIIDSCRYDKPSPSTKVFISTRPFDTNVSSSGARCRDRAPEDDTLVSKGLVLINTLVEGLDLSEIPVENVKYAKSKTAFPGELSAVSIGDLHWETDHGSSYSTDWDREDGAIIFFRDDREEMKSPTKEEQEANSQETNNTTNTSSYISGYSPRKEKPLKIYRDTRPSRSVIDVD